MKYPLTILFIFFVDSLIAQTSYYQNVSTTSSVSLRNQLHELIDNHNVASYNDCRDHLQLTDQDPNNSNNIILIYKQNSILRDWDAGVTWNREHVWAKSLGNFTSGPAYSDLHHLKPADPSVNSSKSNKSFDVGGEQHPEASECFSTQFTWEPSDNVKGDVARMLFYMDVRYEGDGNEPNLTIVEEVDTYPNPNIGRLSTLLQWHIQDPVDDFEINRNEVIYGIQENRNPFIDHPEYVSIIWNTEISVQNGIILSGVMDFDLSGSNGKALHLYAEQDIPDLSVYGIGVANNGEGSDGEEEILPIISVSAGEHILLARNPDAIEDYLGDCYLNFDHVITATSSISQNGDDAIELYLQGQVIEVFGDVDIDGSSQDWEYTDSWAYKINGQWNFGLNCEGLVSQINGSGMFSFDSESLPDNPLMNIYYHVPSSVHELSPILLVMHGASRNADDYRNAFVSKSEELGFIVVAPEFSDNDYPGGDSYNLGNIFIDGDNPSNSSLNSENEWAFSVLDPLFIQVKTLTNNISDSYDVFGNSAGGQFAHRLLMYKPTSPINRLISCASGWYTFTDNEIDFPYGLALSPAEDLNLQSLFNKEMTVMVGALDNDPDAAGLRHTIQAELQGAHRLERATSFYNHSLSMSEAMSIPLAWTLEIIPGIGHDYESMAPFAAEALYSSQNQYTDCFYPFCSQVTGCMNTSACNFNPLADQDNQECEFPILYYDCNSECLIDTDGDGVCDEFELFGCTDLLAINYNPILTEDDGSCEYPIEITNALSLKGVLDLDVPTGGSDGKAIHLQSNQNISNLSIFGIGVANNGGGSDGQEETLPEISVEAGDHILLARSPEALSYYFADCYSHFDHVILAGSGISQNGDDAIELFESGTVIETFGLIDQDGSGQEWEYLDAWAYKSDSEGWIHAALNCSDNTENTGSSPCPYPLCLNVDSPDVQSILLPLGWSIMSTFMNPENNSIDYIFSPVVESLIIAKDYLGTAYLPSYEFNGIGNIEIGRGYSIKMSSTNSLSIYGQYLFPNENPISIVSGWSILGYLRIDSYPVDLIFESLVTNNLLIIVKDFNGSAYLPEYSFNGIGLMNPGQGYQIKTSGPALFEY
jgi:endonuclease I/pimeloyl-ACP methyl ester carboxylesterase